jgi:hypothetical protein
LPTVILPTLTPSDTPTISLLPTLTQDAGTPLWTDTPTSTETPWPIQPTLTPWPTYTPVPSPTEIVVIVPFGWITGTPIPGVP